MQLQIFHCGTLPDVPECVVDVVLKLRIDLDDKLAGNPNPKRERGLFSPCFLAHASGYEVKVNSQVRH